MSETLPPIIARRHSGSEPLHNGGTPLPYTLLDFWRWNVSDLVSNITRGRLAEFIVATALGVDVSGVRNEWNAYDLITDDGIKIEVKSAAYVQSWYQKGFSNIVWQTPRTLAWNPDTNRQDSEPRRQADVYVFALLKHQEKTNIDPLDLKQWCFFVAPTSVLDERKRSQHSITLKSLRNLVGPPVPYEELLKTVTQASEAQGAT